MSTVLRPYRLLGKCLKVIGLTLFLIVILISVALYALNQRSDWAASLLQHWQADIHQLSYQPFVFSQQGERWLLSNERISVDWQAYQIRSQQLSITFPRWRFWPETIQVESLSLAIGPQAETSATAADKADPATALNPYLELQKLRDLRPFDLSINKVNVQQGKNYFLGEFRWQHQNNGTLTLSGNGHLPDYSAKPINFSGQMGINWQKDSVSIALDSELERALMLKLNTGNSASDQDWVLEWQAEWSNNALLALAKEMQTLPLEIQLSGDNISAEGQLSLSAGLEIQSAKLRLTPFSDQKIVLEAKGEPFSLTANMPTLSELEWRDNKAQIQLGTLTLDMDKPAWGKHHLKIEGQQACSEGPCILNLTVDSKAMNLSALTSFVQLPDADATLRNLQGHGELQLDVAAKTVHWAGQFQAHLDGIRYEKNQLKQLELSAPTINADISFEQSSPHIQLAMPTLDITANEVKAGEAAQIAKLSLALENIQMTKAERMDAQLHWDLNVQTIRTPDLKLTGLIGRGELSLSDEQAIFSGNILSDLAEPLLAFTGRHDVHASSQNGQLKWQWNLAPFSSQWSLAKRFGHWPLDVNVLSGEISGGGDVAWQLGESFQWQANGKQSLTKLGGVFSDIGFVDLSIDNSWTLSSSKGPQTHGQLNISSLDVGLPVENIGLAYGYGSESGLIVKDVKAELLDGQVTAPSVQLIQREGLWESETSLVQIREIKLESLLNAADYEGVDATANLSGELPVAIRANKLHIEQGKLAATEPGYIRYAGLADSGNPLMEMVSEALSNYQYEHLSADVEYDDSGYLQMAVALKGRNPDFQDGRQVNLNLNISDNVPNLMKSLQAGRIITDVISEKLDQ